MLGDNTNRIMWIAITAGVVATVGSGALILFPNAMDDGKSMIVKKVANFSDFNNTSDVDEDSYSNDIDANLAYSKLTYTYDTSKGEAAITGFASDNEDNTLLVTPPTVEYQGKTYKVTSVAYGAFLGSKIKQIQFSDNIEYTGMHAFSEVSTLTKVRLSENMQYISPQAFDNTNITTLYVPKSVTKIYGTAFTGTPIKTFYYYSDTVKFTSELSGVDGSVFTETPSKMIDLSSNVDSN